MSGSSGGGGDDDNCGSESSRPGGVGVRMYANTDTINAIFQPTRRKER